MLNKYTICSLLFLCSNSDYESEFTRIRSYIDLAPPKLWVLRRCSRNFDPIFDPIIIAKCNQWGFLRLRITVGRVGDRKNVYYKMYLGSITLMKTYPALFAAIGGRDGMDAGGVHQMTCAIYRTRQPLLVALVVWDVGLIFSLQYIYVSVARMFWSLKGRSPLSICRRRWESVDGSGWHC